MAAQTAQLLLPGDLQGAGKTSDPATTDRQALRAVSAWIDDFVARPNKGAAPSPNPGGQPRILLTSSDRNAAPNRLLDRSGVAGFIPKTELIATDLAPYLG